MQKVFLLLKYSSQKDDENTFNLPSIRFYLCLYEIIRNQDSLWEKVLKPDKRYSTELRTIHYVLCRKAGGGLGVAVISAAGRERMETEETGRGLRVREG